MSFWCELHQLPTCCGFYEAGAFGGDDEDYADVTSNSAPDLLSKILKLVEGRPVIFNFVNPVNHLGKAGGYEYDELRQEVLKNKNVINLGEHINPGTKNQIHSLVIKDYK